MCVCVCVCVCVFTVGLSCVGKFRCGSSSKCVSTLAQCDGEIHCDNGEDELGCGETHTHTHTHRNEVYIKEEPLLSVLTLSQ